MEIAAGEFLHGLCYTVELHADARLGHRLDGLETILIEIDVPDGIVVQENIAYQRVEAVRVCIVESLVGADV